MHFELIILSFARIARAWVSALTRRAELEARLRKSRPPYECNDVDMGCKNVNSRMNYGNALEEHAKKKEYQAKLDAELGHLEIICNSWLVVTSFQSWRLCHASQKLMTLVT